MKYNQIGAFWRADIRILKAHCKREMHCRMYIMYTSYIMILLGLFSILSNLKVVMPDCTALRLFTLCFVTLPMERLPSLPLQVFFTDGRALSNCYKNNQNYNWQHFEHLVWVYRTCFLGAVSRGTDGVAFPQLVLVVFLVPSCSSHE